MFNRKKIKNLNDDVSHFKVMSREYEKMFNDVRKELAEYKFCGTDYSSYSDSFGTLHVRCLEDKNEEVLEDYFTGLPIYKHKATKVIELAVDGRIKEIGYTMRKPDKGFNYKLVRKRK